MDEEINTLSQGPRKVGRKEFTGNFPLEPVPGNRVILKILGRWGFFLSESAILGITFSVSGMIWILANSLIPTKMFLPLLFSLLKHSGKQSFSDYLAVKLGVQNFLQSHYLMAEQWLLIELSTKKCVILHCS